MAGLGGRSCWGWVGTTRSLRSSRSRSASSTRHNRRLEWPLCARSGPSLTIIIYVRNIFGLATVEASHPSMMETSRATTSAVPPTADIVGHPGHVRKVPTTDSCTAAISRSVAQARDVPTSVNSRCAVLACRQYELQDDAAGRAPGRRQSSPPQKMTLLFVSAHLGLESRHGCARRALVVTVRVRQRSSVSSIRGL